MYAQTKIVKWRNIRDLEAELIWYIKNGMGNK